MHTIAVTLHTLGGCDGEMAGLADKWRMIRADGLISRSDRMGGRIDGFYGLMYKLDAQKDILTDGHI